MFHCVFIEGISNRQFKYNSNDQECKSHIDLKQSVQLTHFVLINLFFVLQKKNPKHASIFHFINVFVSVPRDPNPNRMLRHWSTVSFLLSTGGKNEMRTCLIPSMRHPKLNSTTNYEKQALSKLVERFWLCIIELWTFLICEFAEQMYPLLAMNV